MKALVCLSNIFLHAPEVEEEGMLEVSPSQIDPLPTMKREARQDWIESRPANNREEAFAINLTGQTVRHRH